MKSSKLILISFFSALIGAFAALGIYSNFISPKTEVIIKEQFAEAKQVGKNELLLSDKFNRYFTSSEPTSFVKAASEARPSVVFIESFTKISNSTNGARRFTSTTGSGVIISNDGYIVTNHHVVQNADKIEITLNNNQEYLAEVIGSDEQTDLALLKIETAELPYLIFGNSDSLLVGEWVLAVGNPFRLQSSVTAGIVSAKARNINILEQQGIESFIQTDAAVNPGNSGGALLNTNGELIGINTAILSSSGGYEGFSFAIPAQLVKKIVRDLKEFGVVQRGWLGVTINKVDAPLASQINLPTISGVYIDAVTKDGAAMEAGIQRSDVIVGIDNIEINTMPQFMEVIAQYRPGDEIKVDVIRFGKELSFDVVLRNQLNSTDFVAVRKDKVLLDLGFELRDLDTREQERNDDKGAYVVSIYKNSKAGGANIEPGYIITSVNNKRINSVNEFVDYVKGYSGTLVLNGYYENYPGEFPYTFDIK